MSDSNHDYQNDHQYTCNDEYCSCGEKLTKEPDKYYYHGTYIYSTEMVVYCKIAYKLDNPDSDDSDKPEPCTCEECNVKKIHLLTSY
jgi:hypothetical protein